MNKRGQGYTEDMMLFHIVIPLLAIMIGIGMFFYASSNADLTIFWKDFYSKDIALTMDSVYGVNGDMDIIYLMRNPEHKFQYDIVEGQVKVHKDDPRDNVHTFDFATRPSVKLDKSWSLFENFPITRQNNVVSFDVQKPNLCSFVTTTEPNYKQKGYYIEVFGGTQKASEDLKIATKQYLEINGYKIVENSNAPFHIYITQKQDSESRILYDVSSEHSKKLSCIVSQKLNISQQELFIQGNYLMLKNKPSILIDLSKNQDTSNWPQKIEESIKSYFKDV